MRHGRRIGGAGPQTRIAPAAPLAGSAACRKAPGMGVSGFFAYKADQSRIQPTEGAYAPTPPQLRVLRPGSAAGRHRGRDLQLRMHVLRDLRRDRPVRQMPELRRRVRGEAHSSGAPVVEVSRLEHAGGQGRWLCGRCLTLLLAIAPGRTTGTPTPSTWPPVRDAIFCASPARSSLRRQCLDAPPPSRLPERSPCTV